MNKIGNRVIFDQDGVIYYESGETEGSAAPHKEVTKLEYIDLEYGEMDYRNQRLVSVNPTTKQPIFEPIQIEKTQEEIIQELENQLLLLEDEKVGGIL